MASSDEMLSVMEECRVFPPSGSVGEKSLPLTFSDMTWTHSHLLQSLVFYRYPHSKTHFVESTIPSLKRSLSLALKHYYPLAGNLLFPPDLKEPEIHYEDGDSVLVTFAESDGDFDYLIKNHQREVARFHPLIPQLPPVVVQQGTIVAPVFSVQVTLFPNSGISFGFTLNHVVADGNAFIRFMKLWAVIHKSQMEPIVMEPEILPFYNRSTIVKQTKELGAIYWQIKQKINFKGYQSLLPTNNILATFVLREVALQRLKKRVMVRCPTLLHVSRFTVTCAYAWVCIVKARASSGEEVSENESEHFIFVADYRAYLDPPLPENYFGNCFISCLVTAKHSQLMEEGGFMNAVNLIGGTIRERLGSKKTAFEASEKFLHELSSIKKERLVGVAGSPKFAVYDIDFGYGKLQKREVISIDETRSISLHEGRENKQDIEVGLSLPKTKMDAFASIFANGLVFEDL